MSLKNPPTLILSTLALYLGSTASDTMVVMTGAKSVDDLPANAHD